MPRKVNPDEAIALMLEAGVRPLEPYPGAKVGWKVECMTCGSEGRPWYSSVKNGTGGCNVCAKRATAARQRQRGFETAVSELGNAGWRLLTTQDDYLNAKASVKVECMACGRARTGASFDLKSANCECRQSARRPLNVEFPKLADQLHPSKNASIPLQKIGSGMRKNVWWICSKGHEYEASPANRVRGSGCTFCAGQAVLTGFNDLESRSPAIAAQWHPRNHISPEKVHVGSNKTYWWTCPASPTHVYKMSPAAKARGTECPVCAGKKVIAGVNDLATTNPELAAQWHPTLNGNLQPTDVVRGSNKRAVWKCPKGDDHVWETSITGRKGCPYCAGQRGSRSQNLFLTYPELKPLWDFDRNAVNPASLPPGSGRFANWLCSRDSRHRYRRKISAQVRYGGCPVCSGLVVQPGVNDLLTERPMLRNLLHPENTMDVSSLRPGSHVKLRWLCTTNPEHSWKASARDVLDSGCGFCSGRWVSPGVNDLATTHPHLALEWDFKRNELLPIEIKSTSNKKVSWQCQGDEAHVWSAIISSRARGNNCPYCSNQRVLEGNNDFVTEYPALAAERVPRPGEPEPRKISKGSKVRYLWQCKEFADHQWEATVAQRTTHNTGCPICRNLTLKVGFNDLATSHPEVSKDWHPTKNGALSPHDVIAGSHSKVWWQCPNIQEHAFFQSIRDHVMGKSCSICAPRGFRLGKPSKFYFIENEKLGSFKIGITNTDASHDRLSKWNKLGWETIEVVQFEHGQPILALETEMLRWLRTERQLPVFLKPKDVPRIGGFSETFARSAIARTEVTEEIHRRWGRLKNWDWAET